MKCCRRLPSEELWQGSPWKGKNVCFDAMDSSLHLRNCTEVHKLELAQEGKSNIKRDGIGKVGTDRKWHRGRE